MTEVKHHANLLRGGREAWCLCPCGWESGPYRTVVGAHLAFGRHLLAAWRPR